MKLAYHYVPAAFLDEVWDSGAIRPAVERVDPAVFAADCDERISEKADHLEAEGRSVDPAALEALRRLADDLVRGLSAWQEERGLRPRRTATAFKCLDFLAGDEKYVFLEVGKWPWWADDPPSGLVFDAEDLVRKGARVGKVDLAMTYDDVVDRFLTKRRWEDVDDAYRAIEAALEEIPEKERVEGKAALGLLRKGKAKELVWEGRLPTEGAVGAYLEGRWIPAPKVERR